MNIYNQNESLQDLKENDYTLQQLLDLFALMDITLTNQVDLILSTCLELDGEISLLRSEITRFGKRVKENIERRDNLKRYISDLMHTHSISRLRSERFTTTLVHQDKVVVVNASLVPSDFKTTEMTERVSIDQDALNQAVISGEQVPGATLQSTRYITVR